MNAVHTGYVLTRSWGEGGDVGSNKTHATKISFEVTSEWLKKVERIHSQEGHCTTRSSTGGP